MLSTQSTPLPTHNSIQREDFTFRASATSIAEFRESLKWMERELRSSYLDPANIDRLRDLVAEQISADDSYTKQDEFSWVYTPAQAFRYQSDSLYLALESQFTKAHWDGRLGWLLHSPVSYEEIELLGSFATRTLSTAQGLSRSELAQKLSKTEATGLEGELVAHWKRNLDSFPEAKLVDGLRILALEVQEDLRTGPVQTIKELKDLQQLIVNRRALHLDLLVSPSALNALRPDLATFVKSIPNHSLLTESNPNQRRHDTYPIIDKLLRENSVANQDFPWYLGFVASEEVTGNAIFYSDFINYSRIDRHSLLKLLSGGILAGRGPGSLYMKAREAGLAYAVIMRGDPSRGLMLYYADRSLDLPSLVSTIGSGAAGILRNQDPYLIDYAFRQTFSIPRSIYTFSIREQAFVQDVRDGNTPDKVRRFYSALLGLRHSRNLLSELTGAATDSLCGILLEEKCKERQSADHSISFFVGSEKILSDAEKRLPIPRLLRIWPNDYWLP